MKQNLVDRTELEQQNKPVSKGEKGLKRPASNKPSEFKGSVSKNLPTLAMIMDYEGVRPRVFPHTCSLCNAECFHTMVSTQRIICLWLNPMSSIFICHVFLCFSFLAGLAFPPEDRLSS
ncbi:hypothetical protein ATANTOWER_015032 [Ataeniobius toweri]|uniref:Uncharacterized protein n=1 Tax=Ataeniobius toweri TaxID=208326 RepID=A0ABU7C9Y2_9TELE|nr:hypothetical protein [Ataeniobius toweri]